MITLNKISRYKKPDAEDYNRLVERLNILTNVRTHGGLISTVSQGGVNLYTHENKNPIRKAYCKAAAGAAQTITCYLDVDATGTEVTVTCSVAGGGNLNAAIPRLADGDLIFVTNIGGTWYCTTVFQSSINCDCYSA